MNILDATTEDKLIFAICTYVSFSFFCFLLVLLGDVLHPELRQVLTGTVHLTYFYSLCFIITVGSVKALNPVARLPFLIANVLALLVLSSYIVFLPTFGWDVLGHWSETAIEIYESMIIQHEGSSIWSHRHPPLNGSILASSIQWSSESASFSWIGFYWLASALAIAQVLSIIARSAIP